MIAAKSGLSKADLQRYRWLKKSVAQLEAQQADLREQGISSSRPDMSPSGSRSDRMADLVVRIVEVQKQIEAKLREHYELLHHIEHSIETLPPRERVIIRARYLDCKSWEQVAVDMGYSWRQVHNIHAHALRLLRRRSNE